MKRWRNFQRGYGSKHGDSGQSGGGWYRTAERLVSASPPPSPPPSQLTKEGERGKLENISNMIEFVMLHNGDKGCGEPCRRQRLLEIVCE